ncbi:uncharacterized protein MONBRDRAFT_17740 [Monosiga brevicollis MX1]|uniref:Uncharacterized protein n=1 Tax=Monosiga brevicollis TaxID=81824 RepID=A9UR82_MONBE|nr:uncharacterized protein MONBRDRAFT_17740 [Monosiga brevicollis MX1]EDQ92197.1 predicted protein [Monosiga brevicollis MX1]|eukprot:XP_001743483.1 hypothetical protein [Monosiga brevicollis MX1]
MSADTTPEQYQYKAPWPIYSSAWSQKKNKHYRLAIGSFVEDYCNKIQIVTRHPDSSTIQVHSTVDHPYPATKIAWLPDPDDTRPDLLATTGDYLRIWRVEENLTSMECLLNNNKTSEFCAPLTSFDWSTVDPNRIVTSSIDTTCTVWDIRAEKDVGRASGDATTQLIAHDQEVYDVAFSSQNREVFSTVGADGSVRLFDLRSLDHSTIIYEDPQQTALLRLGWNKQDANFLTVLKMDSREVVLVDIRMPCVATATLSCHTAAINGMSWAPHSACHICTAGDDNKAIIWDIGGIPRKDPDPILAYDADGNINNVQWCESFPEWIAINHDNVLELLRV